MKENFKQFFKKEKIVFICLGINFLLGLLTIVPFMLKEGGAFSLGTDYDNIVLPLLTLCRESILDGDVFWSWSFDLGTDFVGAYSFMALGSPFFWLSLIFYKVDYLYLGGWLFILKYAVAGMTSSLYLKRFCEKKQYVLLGSILYSFSGFQAANLMMGTFHDVVAVFPLMLWGLEVLVEDKRKGIFAITVCLNALTNYYFFVGEVIFLVLYFVIRFLMEDMSKIRRVIPCMAEGILGIAMAAVLFVPSVLFILQNPRSSSIIPLSDWLLTNRRDMLKLLRAFLFPGEMMQQWSCVRESDWTSCSAYLPMVGVVLVIAYVWKKIKKKDWLKRMMIVCGIFMVTPVLCSLFTFMTDVYYRWYYMPILLFALGSVRVLENITEYPVKRIATAIGGFMILVFCVFEWWDKNQFQLIFWESAYWILNILGILGVIITGIVSCFYKSKKGYFILLLLSICAFAVFTTGYTVVRYQSVRGYDVSQYEEKTVALQELVKEVNIDTLPYRTYSTDNLVAANTKLSPVGSAFSNVQGSIFELWNLLGEERRVVCPEIPQGYYELVGAKYRVTSSVIEDKDWVLMDAYMGIYDRYYSYQRENARSIGVTYNFYMLESDFANVAKEERATLMNSVLIIAKSDEGLVKGVLEKYSPEKKLTEQKSISDFARNEEGFCCTVATETENGLLFSIPYAEGWKAYVNGEEADILKTSGFMAVLVPAGECNIEFVYTNKNVVWGASVSVLGLLIELYILVRNKMKMQKNVKTIAPYLLK